MTLVPVTLALGSNLGDRLARLGKAVLGLGEGGVEVESLSSVYESPPAGYAEQPHFLNAALLGRTRLSPVELLDLARRLETEAGRERSFPNAPRPLDVDIVLYGDRVIRRPGLRIPHERWRDRAFVLVPLREIAPGLRDPESERTVAELCDDLAPQEREGVRLVEPPGALVVNI